MYFINNIIINKASGYQLDLNSYTDHSFTFVELAFICYMANF